jgi:hypothetical protein
MGLIGSYMRTSSPYMKQIGKPEPEPDVGSCAIEYSRVCEDLMMGLSALR